MEESNSTEFAVEESKPVIPPETAPDDGYKAWVSEPAPQHAEQAFRTYLADLDTLLSHLIKNPSDRWVAYRGPQLLGFGSDERTLYRECLAKFPDRQFCLYGIDASARCQDPERTDQVA